MFSIKKIILPFVIVLSVVFNLKCDNACDKLGVLLYEQIGCKPIKDKPEDACPKSFDCSHLDEEGEHCFFGGKKYKDREELPDNATIETCDAGCFCDTTSLPGKRKSLTKFTCAAFDCPEFLGANPFEDPNCIHTYELGGCCASGQICPPFSDVATCDVDGKTYKEGERFDAKDSCTTCVCQKNFEGKFVAPFCKRDACAVEITHLQDIKDKCAPVYEDENKRCCPYLWICPHESDVFTPAQKEEQSGKTCKFGAKEIKAGQVLKRSLERYGRKYDLKCDCQLPPFITCTTVQ